MMTKVEIKESRIDIFDNYFTRGNKTICFTNRDEQLVGKIKLRETRQS